MRIFVNCIGKRNDSYAILLRKVHETKNTDLNTVTGAERDCLWKIRSKECGRNGPPENFKVNACALNCGCYFFPFSRLLSPKRCNVMFEAYFPEDYVPILKQLKVARYATKDFPPAFVMTAANDYLKMMAKPMTACCAAKAWKRSIICTARRKKKRLPMCSMSTASCLLRPSAMMSSVLSSVLT